MAVTVAISLSGGTPSERAEVVALAARANPKPADFAGTDVAWLAEALVAQLEAWLQAGVEQEIQADLAPARRAARARVVRA